MNWKNLLAYITGSVDEELLLRNEYLVAENWITVASSRPRAKRRGGSGFSPRRGRVTMDA